MAHKADDEKVDIQSLDQPDHYIHDVSRNKVGLDRHTSGRGLGPGGFDNGREPMVRLILLLRDFVDAGRKPRQLLDRHHVDFGRSLSRQFERGCNGGHVSRSLGGERLEGGWNHRCANNVGTTALPITAVTRIVYLRK